MSFFHFFCKKYCHKDYDSVQAKGALECGHCGWGPWWKKSSSSAGTNDIEDFQIAAKTPRPELDTPFSNGRFLKNIKRHRDQLKNNP